MNLLKLSSDELSTIMQKMSRKSQCRLRRAHKIIDTTAEEKRSEMEKYWNPEPLSLVMTASSGNNITCHLHKSEDLLLQEHRKPGFGFDLFEKELDRRRHPERRIQTKYFENEGVLLKNPYLQISTQRLNIFILDIQNVENSKVESLLKQLTVQCNHFLVNSEKGVDTLNTLIPLVNFSIIDIRFPIEFKTLNRLPIQHCMKATFYDVEISNEQISMVLSSFRVPEVTIMSKNDRLLGQRFEEFLLELEDNSQVKGKLEKLKFIRHVEWPDPLWGTFYLAPVVMNESKIICRIILKNYKYLRFFPLLQQEEETIFFTVVKMNYGGATLMVFRRFIFIEIIFMTDDSPESIFDKMAPYIFPKIPFDVSSVFDDYLATYLASTNKEEAFKVLLKGFREDIKFRQ